MNSVRRSHLLYAAVLMALVACQAGPATGPSAPPSAAALASTSSSVPRPSIVAASTQPLEAPTAIGMAGSIPLAHPGPFAVGIRDTTFSETSRERYQIPVTIWYPAVAASWDAAPDTSAAPYPLVVYSHGYGGDNQEVEFLTRHLASYGFVVAAPDHPGSEDQIWIDRPLDVVFVIDQLANPTGSDLARIIDQERVGLIGWSLGATTALQMGGVRMDWPATQKAGCSYHPDPARCLEKSFAEQFTALWDRYGKQDANGLWYVPTKRPIRAVVAMAPCCARIFGERGFAAATAPVLLLHGTADDNPAAGYEQEGVYIYNQYGARDRTLISFIGGTHTLPLDETPRVQHFVVAFFGYTLQGQADYARYLTQDAVDRMEGLVWGAYDNNK